MRAATVRRSRRRIPGSRQASSPAGADGGPPTAAPEGPPGSCAAGSSRRARGSSCRYTRDPGSSTPRTARSRSGRDLPEAVTPGFIRKPAALRTSRNARPPQGRRARDRRATSRRAGRSELRNLVQRKRRMSRPNTGQARSCADLKVAPGARLRWATPPRSAARRPLHHRAELTSVNGRQPVRRASAGTARGPLRREAG